MSSILDLDADCSSDENDGDYVPPNGVVASDSSGEDDASLDEDSEPDQELKSRKGKRKTKKSKEPEVEVAPSVPPVDQKKHAENVWLDFLADVSKSTPTAKKPIAPKCNETTTTSEIPNEKPKPLSTQPANGTKAEVFEFAGETFTVSDEKVESQECPHTFLAKPNSAGAISASPVVVPKKRGGVESILGSISNKKKKLTTLDKTLLDWNTFKKSEGLAEDLEKHNKGKGGFIERQRFLERSDVRSFEIEKSMRQSKRKM